MCDSYSLSLGGNGDATIGSKHVSAAFNNNRKAQVLLNADLGPCPKATENSVFLSSGLTVLTVWEVGGHHTASVRLLCRKV